MIPSLLLLALALQYDTIPVISPVHPRAASPWVQSVEAHCGRNILSVSGYGAGRPLDSVPRLRFNGRPLTGQGIERLQRDLSHRGAVYRLELLCGIASELAVRVNVGERQRDGSVRYQVGVATIRHGRLASYGGLEASNEDTFWFR